MAKKNRFRSDRKRVVEESKYDQLYGAESDRGKVILGTTRLDDLLRLLISRTIINGNDVSDDELFDDQMSILQSFGAKIAIAYRFGLISESEHDNLKIIKDIRNKFAHNLHDISFDHQWVRDACLRFRFPDNLLPEETSANLFRFQSILNQLDLELQRRIALSNKAAAVKEFTWEEFNGVLEIKE
jgi:hypothetical protein